MKSIPAMSAKRRGSLAALMALALSAVLPLPASAQAYPGRPVTLLIGYTPGGAGDAIARLMAAKYTEVFGQAFNVDNKPGANATIAAAAAARAAPDGYTLLVNTGPDSTIGPITMKGLPYVVERDFAPISLLTIVPSVLVVPADSPYKSVKDVIDAARAAPNKLNYASFGNGSSAHMSAELLKSLAGVQIAHIPFKGSAPAMTELLAGRVDVLFDTFASAGAQIRAGKVRALAVTSAARVPLAPDVPTMQEAGVPGYVSQAFIGITAPAGTPKPVLQRLEQETRHLVEMPDVRKRIADVGMVAVGSSAADYMKFLASETERNRKLIQSANLTFE